MTARQHHYIPQCYLKGFTRGKAKKSKLTVIDIKQEKRFETIPRNVGGVRDFNRIEIENIDPNAVESALSEFESSAAAALKRLEETLDFTGQTRVVILNLVALLAVRSPERREQIGGIEKEIMERVLETSLDSKERWEAKEAKKRQENPEYKTGITYEELKAFFDSKQYQIKLTTESHLRNEMHMIDVVLPLLNQRKWSLIQATENTGPFITSDNPVCLNWNNPSEVPPLYRSSPGFGMGDTQLYFPISKDLALVGEFDKEDSTLVATNNLVAILNTKMLHNTYKQVYSPKVGFTFISKNGAILDGSRMFNEGNA